MIYYDFSDRCLSPIQYNGPKSRHVSILSIDSLKSDTESTRHLNILTSSHSIHEDFELIDSNLFKSSGISISLYFHRPSHDQFVLKTLKKNGCILDSRHLCHSDELVLTKTFKHPSIETLVSTDESQESLFFLYERPSKLLYFVEISENPRKSFMCKSNGGIEKLRSFTFDILSTLKYLNQKGFIFLNLKPGNIWLDERETDEIPVVKLVDFGRCLKTNENGKALIDFQLNPDLFDAPEVKFRGTVSENADIWSLGILLYICAVGYSPKSVGWKIGSELPMFKKNWNKFEGSGLFEFIDACLKFDSEDRMTVHSALKHKWQLKYLNN